MSANITLKNIPDAIYERLKEAAELHRRSLNNEAIACLERVLLPSTAEAAERLARARQIRAALRPGKFKASEIAKAVRQDRP